MAQKKREEWLAEMQASQGQASQGQAGKAQERATAITGQLPTPGITDPTASQLIQNELLREGLTPAERAQGGEGAIQGASGAPPQAIDINPLAQTTSTPYGDITVTRPAGALSLQASAVNPLTQEATLTPAIAQTNVMQTAEAYRNAPSEQRGRAMADYARALEAKAVLAREAGGAPPNQTSRPMLETGAMYAAQAFGKPAFGGGAWPERPPSAAQVRENRMLELVPPAERAQRKAELAKLTPDQQAAEYFGEKGETWKQTLQPVRSFDQQAQVQAMVQRAAKESRNMAIAEREARTPSVDEKGRRQPPDYKEADRIGKKRYEHDKEAGFMDPDNPTAGLNIDRALRVADKTLFGDRRSTLTGIAKAKPTERAKEAEPKQSEQNQQQLEAANEKARLEREAYLDDLRRRQALAFLNRGNLAAAY